MARLRSSSFPRFAGPADHDETMDSPSRFHSRQSSAGSSSSIPITPISARGHGHWPSSGSSNTSASDSPVNPSKSPLGDLVEDPEERDEPCSDFSIRPLDEVLCICDNPFCEHQRTPGPGATVLTMNQSREWLPGDDSHVFAYRSTKRRKSNDPSPDSLTSRLGRRWPSISQRWRDHHPTTSLSSPSVRSAPPTRSSSLRLPSLKRSLANQLDVSSTAKTTPKFGDPWSTRNATGRPTALPTPLDISLPSPVEDPVDRNELSRTPLLPPMMHEYREYHSHSHGQVPVQSPLQSPSVAPLSNKTAAMQSPTSTPVLGMANPSLSSQPSVASFNYTSPLAAISDISMGSSQEMNPWALKLGHANFHILPEPYFPDVCTKDSCRRLLDDWEAARTEFICQAARVSEHYGPTSNIFKLTELKWNEIDAVWRANHELANTHAGASGENLVFQPLADTAPSPNMPSLSDQKIFPTGDEKFIVGPMVQYAKMNHQTTVRRPGLLRLFTDPVSLLGKSSFGVRR